MISPVGVAGVLALGLAGVVFIMDRVAVSMLRPPLKRIRKRIGALPFRSESISVVSGGYSLAAWVLHPDEDCGGPVLVLAHGWGSNHGTVARLAGPLLKAGYPTVLFDVRHHGKSRGAPYVTARHFRDDTQAVIREAAVRFPGRGRVLIGHSMGGSTGVLAVADGAPVQGLITIGAPADLWEVWAHHLNRRGLPGKWMVKVFRPFWRIRAGVPWASLDPERRTKELDLPYLAIHGDQDESVRADQALILAGATGVEPLILEGQGHTDLLESPELHEAVLGFLESLRDSTIPAP